jgi:hypothetical protein
MMCSPLVVELYFSAQAVITNSPSKLALQIGVLWRHRAQCDAASVAQLYHIDQVYRIALDGVAQDATSTAALRWRRAAQDGLQLLRPSGDPASTLTMWPAIAELTYNVADPAGRKLQ